jgi:hypothetical protein
MNQSPAGRAAARVEHKRKRAQQLNTSIGLARGEQQLTSSLARGNAKDPAGKPERCTFRRIKVLIECRSLCDEPRL